MHGENLSRRVALWCLFSVLCICGGIIAEAQVSGGTAVSNPAFGTFNTTVSAPNFTTTGQYMFAGGGYLSSSAGNPVVLDYPSGGSLQIQVGGVNVTGWGASGVETVVYGFAVGNGSVMTNIGVGAKGGCSMASTTTCTVAVSGCTASSVCFASVQSNAATTNATQPQCVCSSGTVTCTSLVGSTGTETFNALCID